MYVRGCCFFPSLTDKIWYIPIENIKYFANSSLGAITQKQVLKSSLKVKKVLQYGNITFKKYKIVIEKTPIIKKTNEVFILRTL
jgi:hypothetical protein